MSFKESVSTRVTTEANLRTLLWTTNSYDSLVRPDDTVNVTIKLYPMSLLDLDIAEGSMTAVGFFTFEWTDSRLDWSSNAAYSSIITMFSTGKYTWFPSLVLLNSIDELDILMDPDNQNPIRVANDGSCEYLMLKVMKVSCDTYATYYPFDTQTCRLVIASWGYNEAEIAFVTKGVSTSFYIENGEWEYTGDAEKSKAITRGHQQVPTLSFDLTFRRRPIYQVLNIFLPTVMIGFLISGAFVLPPDSGERMGYSLTTLLAYAVYLTMAADSLPTVSLNVAYLSIYLNITVVSGGAVVVLSKIVLSCHHASEDDPIPTFLVKMYTGWAGQLAGMRKMQCFWNKNTKETNVVDVKEQTTESNNEDLETQKEMEINWPIITKFLDKLFFRFFLLITILQQIVFGIIFLYGYLCACNPDS